MLANAGSDLYLHKFIFEPYSLFQHCMTHHLGNFQKVFCVWSRSMWDWPGWRQKWCESLFPVSALLPDSGRVWPMGEEEEGENVKKKAYSAGFLMLKSVSAIPKSQWLTQVHFHKWLTEAMTEWFLTGVFELVFLLCCVSHVVIVVFSLFCQL